MEDGAVVLNLYDVSRDSAVEGVNDVLCAMGTGAFHGGVEVYGVEYSYGYTASGTGVFMGEPRGCQAHRYRGSVQMGRTQMSRDRVSGLVEQLRGEWPGQEYDLLRRNCVQFSREMVDRLGCGPVPDWVTNLAGAGATLQDGLTSVVSQAQAAAIVALAKTGEIDSRYDVRGQAQARAQDVLRTVDMLSRQSGPAAYGAASRCVDIANTAGLKAEELACTAAARAGQLDEQYRVRETATMVAARLAVQASELDSRYRLREGAAGLAARAATRAGELDQQYGITEAAADWAVKALESIAQGPGVSSTGQPGTSRMECRPDQGHAPRRAAGSQQRSATEEQEPARGPLVCSAADCTVS